ncbi:MAG: hypothetical protein ACLSVD_08215 [Eggerthellaceae bacterium]
MLVAKEEGGQVGCQLLLRGERLSAKLVIPAALRRGFQKAAPCLLGERHDRRTRYAAGNLENPAHLRAHSLTVAHGVATAPSVP